MRRSPRHEAVDFLDRSLGVDSGTRLRLMRSVTSPCRTTACPSTRQPGPRQRRKWHPYVPGRPCQPVPPVQRVSAAAMYRKFENAFFPRPRYRSARELSSTQSSGKLPALESERSVHPSRHMPANCAHRLPTPKGGCSPFMPLPTCGQADRSKVSLSGGRVYFCAEEGLPPPSPITQYLPSAHLIVDLSRAPCVRLTSVLVMITDIATVGVSTILATSRISC